MVRTKYIVMCALFAVLTAIGAQIRIPFPVVPLTLQTFVVILSGLLLGSSGGALSQGLYLFMGLMGIPVFAGGGGLHYILHPTFGFLAGFVPGAWVVGHMTSPKKKMSPLTFVPACIAGIAIIYLCGLSVLYMNLNFLAGKPFSVFAVIRMGMLPFIPGDVVKVAAASLMSARIVPTLYRAGITR